MQVDITSITIEDYSVQVKGIPPDTEAEELLHFLQAQFGQVGARGGVAAPLDRDSPPGG